MKKIILQSAAALSLAAFISTGAHAQDQAATFLKTGTDNANGFANAYLGPLMRGFGQGMNDGWNNNTAKTLGTGGFDLRLNLGSFFVPTKDQTYQLSDVFHNDPNAPTKLVAQPGTPNEQSSLFGPNNSNAGGIDVKATYAGHDTTITSFKLPPGTGSSAMITLPSLQLSVGIVKNTEIMLRFIPTVTAGDFKAGSWGFGAKHSLKQYIPAIKDQKRWDWSAYGAFSSFHSEYGMGNNGLQPDPSAYNPQPNTDYSNQKIEMKGTGFTLGTLVSAKLLFFTPYLGVNYSYSSFQMQFTGNYPVPGPNDDAVTLAQGKITKINNIKDPLTIDGTMSNMRLNAGFRLKLAVVVIGAEYSLARYSTATFSLGLNLQSIAPFKL